MEVSVQAWHLRGFLACLPVALIVSFATTFGHDPTVAGVLTPLGLPVVAGLGWVVLRRLGLHQHQRSLLLWPTTVGLLMVVLNMTTPHAAVNLLGLFVLAFLYLGLCQPPRTAWWGIVPTLPVYLWILGVEHDTLLVRAPLAVLIWFFVCELPARLLEALREQGAELGRLAATDPLTGLSNRTRLDPTIAGLGSADSVALIDLDHFKRFNDAFGHPAGDGLLRDFAACLRDSARSADGVFRYGGEEFVLVLPGTTPEASAGVLRRVAERWHASHPDVTFSAGVVSGAGEDRLGAADALLYRAKREGRDRVLVEDGTDPGGAEASLPQGAGS
jgi:diguanylate cyclase (GGDEF)-like protein